MRYVEGDAGGRISLRKTEPGWGGYQMKDGIPVVTQLVVKINFHPDDPRRISSQVAIGQIHPPGTLYYDSPISPFYPPELPERLLKLSEELSFDIAGSVWSACAQAALGIVEKSKPYNSLSDYLNRILLTEPNFNPFVWNQFINLALELRKTK